MAAVIRLEKASMKNTFYRRVLHTNAHQQLVVMSLLPNQEIGLEVHKTVSQFIRIEGGSGRVQLGRRSFSVGPGDAVVVPAGCKHNVTAGHSGLKLYTVYAPPNHPLGARQRVKA